MGAQQLARLGTMLHAVRAPGGSRLRLEVHLVAEDRHAASLERIHKALHLVLGGGGHAGQRVVLALRLPLLQLPPEARKGGGEQPRLAAPASGGLCGRWDPQGWEEKWGGQPGAAALTASPSVWYGSSSSACMPRLSAQNLTSASTSSGWSVLPGIIT